ncbi:MAG: LysR substrate-binding domain-containing protein [Methyloligellaceae bacterium]
MDTRFLESFIAVVDQGSIAAAARTLNVTPAAVAQRVRALENEIGSALVSRTGRTVSPTEAGLAILDRARSLTRDVRDLQALASGNEPMGELRIGATSTGVSGLLPPVLSTLSKRYPAMKVSLRRGHSSELYRHVLDRQVDVAMVTAPNFSLPKACDWCEIRREPLVLITPKPIHTADPSAILRTEPFIRYNQGRWGSTNIANYLREVGVRPEERFELDTLDAIVNMVSRGLGVSLIPDFAPPWPEGLSISKTLIADTKHERQIGLIWLRASARLRLIRAFVQEFSESS